MSGFYGLGTPMTDVRETDSGAITNSPPAASADVARKIPGESDKRFDSKGGANHARKRYVNYYQSRHISCDS